VWLGQAGERTEKGSGPRACVRAGPREEKREEAARVDKFLFFLFQKCKMIFSFVIYVINYL
jgi:hypothetical protein